MVKLKNMTKDKFRLFSERISRIYLMVINVLVIAYCLPYVLEIIEGKSQSDGLHYVASSAILFFFSIPIVLLSLFATTKKQFRHLLICLFAYFIISCLGLNAAPFGGSLISLIFLLISIADIKRKTNSSIRTVV